MGNFVLIFIGYHQFLMIPVVEPYSFIGCVSWSSLIIWFFLITAVLLHFVISYFVGWRSRETSCCRGFRSGSKPKQ